MSEEFSDGQVAPASDVVDSPASSTTRRRPPWWLVAVVLVVGLGAGIGTGALIWAGRDDAVSPPGYQASLSPEQYDKCVRNVTVFFDGDDPDPAMRAAADELRGDNRVESVQEQTRQQAFVKYKEMFADQPELLELARPEALPASLQLVVRAGSNGQEVKAALMTEFPGTDVIMPDYCPGS